MHVLENLKIVAFFPCIILLAAGALAQPPQLDARSGAMTVALPHADCGFTNGGIYPEVSSLFINGAGAGAISVSVLLSSLSPVAIQFSASNSNHSDTWLNVVPASGQVFAHAPAEIIIIASTAGLTPGQKYTGSITINANNWPPITIPVTLNLGPDTKVTSTLTPSQSCVTLGMPLPLSQTIFITGANLAGYSTDVTTSSGGNWLSISFASPMEHYISVVLPVAQTLPNGEYHGSVIYHNSDGPDLVVPVTLTVTGGMTFSPATMAFNTSTSAQQYLTVNSWWPVNFFASVQTFSGQEPWLAINPNGPLASPANIAVNVSAAGLAPGTYTGEVDISVYQTVRTVPITLTVPPVTLTVTNNAGNLNALSFTAPSGGQVSSPQQVGVAATSGISGAAFTFSTSASWLLVNNTSAGQARTPATLSVTANPRNLSAGNYSASFSVTPTGGQAVTVPVSMIVTPAPFVSATPSHLTLNWIAGGVAPQSQTIQVSGNGGAVPFTATAVSAGNWLVVNPSSGTTSTSGTTTLTVSFTNLSSLAPNQTYTGTILVAGTGSGAGSSTISVSLSVGPPVPSISAVVNAASFDAGPISPGEIVTLFGSSLGPDVGAGLTQDRIINGKLPTTLAGVQVLIGGFPAPLVYASGTQISAIVPYEIFAPAFVSDPVAQVEYGGQISNSVSLVQAASAPGIFTATMTGRGQGAILNANLSPNSPDNPANKGEAVVLYVTGEGQTVPPGVSGTVTPLVPPWPQPTRAPTVTIGGQPALVLFYAEAPGLVAGLLQVNVQIPMSIPSGAVPVVVTFADKSSQPPAGGSGTVTVAIR